VCDLHLWRGKHHLLRGVSFTLQAGELLQVQGDNAVGKTSDLRAIAGLLPLEFGDCRWTVVHWLLTGLGTGAHHVRRYHQQLPTGYYCL
jgi:ABC-type transport system involved in cytochrome c biogenesis ATPase subunit